ncbi:hypothetical protein DC080_04950 [Ignatzschineria cameli]|nr:hypothetical protein DC080_04950 [Ignatzschineria cameli]
MVQNQQSDKFTFSLLTILASLSLLTIVVVLVISFVKFISNNTDINGKPFNDRELVAERLTPYGRVNTGNLVSDVVKAKAPQDVYAALCASCHDTGLNDAPLTGDNAAWSTRFSERGLDGLHTSAIKGRNLMPAKGGDPRLTDEEVINTVDFMLAKSGIEVASNDPAEDIVAEESATEAEVGEPEVKAVETEDAELVEKEAIEQEAVEAAEAEKKE